MFDHYVFLSNGMPGEHLPPDIRGVLAPSDQAGIARLKRDLRHNLREEGPDKVGPFA